jgi:hypothetical protein
LKSRFKISVLALLTLILFTGQTSKADVKTNGFVDARYQFNHGKLALNGASVEQGDLPNTFLIKDGALYISSEKENSSAYLDLAFGQVNSSGGGATASLGFAASRSQAFVSHKYDMGLDWKLGRFDTPFGFEAVDTKDILLATQGLVWSLMPFTHDGIFVNYKFAQFNLGVFAGNSNQLGTQAQGRELEIGAKLSWISELYRLSLGYLGNQKDKTASGTEFNRESIVDVAAGATMSLLNVDITYDVFTPASKTYTTPTAEVKPVQAFLAQVSYEFLTSFWGIVRFEQVTNGNIGTMGLVDDSAVTSAITNQNGSMAQQVTAGLKHRIDEALTAKAEANFANFKLNDQSDSKSVSYVTGAVAAVYNF